MDSLDQRAICFTYFLSTEAVLAISKGEDLTRKQLKHLKCASFNPFFELKKRAWTKPPPPTHGHSYAPFLAYNMHQAIIIPPRKTEFA